MKEVDETRRVKVCDASVTVTRKRCSARPDEAPPEYCVECQPQAETATSTNRSQTAPSSTFPCSGVLMQPEGTVHRHSELEGQLVLEAPDIAVGHTAFGRRTEDTATIRFALKGMLFLS